MLRADRPGEGAPRRRAPKVQGGAAVQALGLWDLCGFWAFGFVATPVGKTGNVDGSSSLWKSKLTVPFARVGTRPKTFGNSRHAPKNREDVGNNRPEDNKKKRYNTDNCLVNLEPRITALNYQAIDLLGPPPARSQRHCAVRNWGSLGMFWDSVQVFGHLVSLTNNQKSQTTQ